MPVSDKTLTLAGVVALLFGGATVISGGRVLFGGPEAVAAAGNVVGFVLWFNFLAGFVYCLAGGALILRHRAAVWLSLLVFGATALVGLAFGYHVTQGGAFEMRTVGAMALRTAAWAVMSWVALRGMAKG